MSAFGSSSKFGLILQAPSILATLTSEVASWKGMSETIIAADAAKQAKESVATFSSAEIREMVTIVLAWKSEGNKGLKALSTNLETNTSPSEGRFSLFKNPPGKRPIAENFSR